MIQLMWSLTLTSDLDRINSLLNMAFAHHRIGQVSEAEGIYRQVLELDATQPHALSLLGMIVLANTDKTEAEALFHRCLEIDPGNANALHNLGRIKQAQCHHQQAVEFFRQSSANNANLAPVFNDLAVSLSRLGQRDEALIALNQALLIDPNYGVAYDNLGLLLADCHRHEEAARAHLASFIRLPDDASVAQRASVLLHYADAAYEIRELQASEQACELILQINPHNEEALSLLAKVLYRMCREDEGLALLNELARLQGVAIKGQSNHPEATVLEVPSVFRLPKGEFMLPVLPDAAL